MIDYEKIELEKFKLVIDAALQNTSNCEVHLHTTGNNPNASVTIEAYILEKLIRKLE